eukprot:1159638-Pelagomonas_calceolata.AAC.2
MAGLVRINEDQGVFLGVSGKVPRRVSGYMQHRQEAFSQNSWRLACSQARKGTLAAPPVTSNGSTVDLNVCALPLMIWHEEDVQYQGSPGGYKGTARDTLIDSSGLTDLPLKTLGLSTEKKV